MSEFQSSRPLRGATRISTASPTAIPISILAPLAGRDMAAGLNPVLSAIFQSSRPLRGATPRRRAPGPGSRHFNPRAPCGARRCTSPGSPQAQRISILAPLAGRDARPGNRPSCQPDFNPRAPCGARQHPPDGPVQLHGISILAPLAGRDFRIAYKSFLNLAFQSSRPLRGATAQSKVSEAMPVEFQSSRPLRGATSYTPPTVGSGEFQSSRPLRGATFSPPFLVTCSRDFNPRAPCGARPPACSSRRYSS